MSQTCEACENARVEKLESCDNEAAPYRLCSACFTRLHHRALRPIEWYNLAKRHGWWQHLLHDDFYGDDGTAFQPDCEVQSPELYPAPTLQEVAGDPEALLDFTITRWRFSETVARMWQDQPATIALNVVTRRFAQNQQVGIRSALLDVAATIGQHCEGFVRYAWGEYPESVDLSSMARASASCLPFREGFDQVVDALKGRDERERRQLMFSLSYFRSSEALDWIERNIFSPITEDWGRLAAASELDWTRVAKWLDLGRPLSLVALDALAALIRTRTPLLRVWSPRLLRVPDSETLAIALRSCAEKDPVPRVERITGFILDHASCLIGVS